MSLSSLSKFLPSGMRERANDPLSQLRFVLDTLPNTRGATFTAATRADVLSELYDAFWGHHMHLFLPSPSLPRQAMLSDIQRSLGFCGAGKDAPIMPGRLCGQMLKKGECCFRCKDCALDDSCVLCPRCFHATDHVGHNVSFFVAQQSGGCCDCGDEEAWRQPIRCPHHPQDDPMTDISPSSSATIIPTRTTLDRAQVPTELRESMNRTVGCVLDFILDTLDYSPDEPMAPKSEAELRKQPSAELPMKDSFCVVLWNDEKHSFDEVIKLLCDKTGMTVEAASETAHRIDECGRDVVESSTNITKLLDVAQGLSTIDLGVTVRRAYDTFREQVVSVMIEWLLDLTQARLGTDTLILREIVSEELLSRRRTSFTSAPNAIYSLPDIASMPTRLDILFLYHARLWKKPRLNLREVYTSVLTLSHPHKLAIAGHFASVYHRVIDTYLLVDHEAETSIKYFALQLFTTPSVAAHITRNYKLITRLLSIITSFFTNQIVDKRIVYPPVGNATLDIDASPFKSKRFMPVFSDLRYLCHNPPVQKMIAHNRSFITEFAKTCQLFMCVNPNKRAATNHVEYETDAWISVFNVTLSLSRVIKVYGDAFSHASTAELVAAIAVVLHHILLVCTLRDDRSILDRNKFSPIVVGNVEFGDATYRVIQFDVAEGWTSFHHSLHWLLAELWKHTNLLEEHKLREIGMSTVREMMLSHASEQAILTMVDFPLRVLVMIAQIRTGLWVRNGFAIRGQLLHYRDFMLRELCYDQDLFILQIALAILDPNTVIVTILERFNLVGYFSGVVLHSLYEGAHLPSMVEEILYIFITILSEASNAGQLDTSAQIRREIIHALALGGCSYTDLVKRVAERLVEDVHFESVLSDVAAFRAPEGVTDTGVYELKDEVFDEVNPFFFHYSRNKREEVETILMNRLRKKTGLQDPVIVPRPFPVTRGPFSIIPSTFESEALLQVMFYSIFNVLAGTEEATPPSAEAILDQVVHLVMLALVERGPTFSQLCPLKAFERNTTLLDVLCTLEHHDKYKSYHARVGWILNQIAQYVPEEVNGRRHVPDLSTVHADAADAKKRAAKARQEAIMKQMKEQQASFAFNFDDVDDEDEDMADDTQEQPVSYGTCIVCQEDLNVHSAKQFGMLGMVQPSRFMRRQPDGFSVGHLKEALSVPVSLDRSTAKPSSTFPPPNAEIIDAKVGVAANFDGFPAQYTRFGLHASVCSHMMHLECFHQYNLSIRQRHRAQATRNHPESIPRKEFVCPLCKSLGNVILPVTPPPTAPLNMTPFPDWIRAAGISILKSRPDNVTSNLQFRTGTGEFSFWSAQDPPYSATVRALEKVEGAEAVKMVDTVMAAAKAISQQTRHLRDRLEPDSGERGAGIYLPEELVGYTISCIEAALRGTDSPSGFVVDNLTEPQAGMIRGLLFCMEKLAGMNYRGRPDEGREAVRQAIIKRLLPEWSRSSLTSYSYPLLLRDPFTLLVETAAVAPDILRHVLVLTYYACLARTVIGLVFLLNKVRTYSATPSPTRAHTNIFGDVRMFFMSVVRHSPVFEHTATLAFDTFGEARIEKFMYAFTLPFLRKAALLCRAVLPSAFPTPTGIDASMPEYDRLLMMLGIPSLADLPNQDTLQNALSGWCAHYGHSHAASPMNFGVAVDSPVVYRMARLPLVLDNLFLEREKTLMCGRCATVPVDGAICLLCGATVCMQSDCCTDADAPEARGECNMHTRECGGAIGIFFLVKRCSLLYLYASNGTFAQSPYLDVHGEVDINTRRGRRQYIHQPRLDDIRKTWLNHGIPTVIARKLESSMDSGGWETL
ncbi:hypothetical protein CYLTODRAFT_387655 [Cylindrobasidium torrendii FP15055 ss-10]|uniref:E3 ubiquitin-protein ligase n=1 Tax=Cylindrobasidium torrendii FP15055 ss-10 TaxID=1314674 RepID=A0A0D7BRF7_9AGAR|nr:hypothetical protein CYLTODRAFT_387655 [Cylindrobasidium torrendii FP15055 ss-10]